MAIEALAHLCAITLRLTKPGVGLTNVHTSCFR